MADNPVAYWRLDETNDTSVVLDDAKKFRRRLFRSHRHVYLWLSHRDSARDRCRHSRGTNSAIVTIPYALELNPVTTPWSYEFWIQPTSQDVNNFHTPISAEGNQNSGVNLSGWNIYQHVAGVWTWNIYNGGNGGSFTSEFTDNPIGPGEWYHMVLTDDTTNMNWYSNGRLAPALTTSASA